jgi:2,3-bisphosphoglycerate-independent phosphoglycerate mutase
MDRQKVLLIVMDGYGLRDSETMNAIKSAGTPNLDRFFKEGLFTGIEGSGAAVGLPQGQMGNSEVGHMNIGAGRVVFQDISRINNAIKDGSFYKNEAFLGAMNHVKQEKKQLHLIGLVSNGGVHSSMDHLEALLRMAKKEGVERVYLHALTDGRDTSPQSGKGFIAQVEGMMKDIGVGEIATVCGRYWAMDRDKRWDRVERGYNMLTKAEGKQYPDAEAVFTESYAGDVTDEFIDPSVITRDGNPKAKLEAGDALVYFNFRVDRVREMTHALLDDNFTDFPRGEKVPLHYVSITSVESNIKEPIAFGDQHYTDILGEIVQDLDMRQLRISETEKYAHVTYFFNVGREEPFDNEERSLIPSPKVATYDLQPEMSSVELTEKALAYLSKGDLDFTVLNYPNCDMVGHTGILEAAEIAVRAVDTGVGKLIAEHERQGGVTIITADHGNSEQMWDNANNLPHTAHTTNPVPFCLFNYKGGGTIRHGGKLADIAPTILKIWGVPQPEAMTGESLLID